MKTIERKVRASNGGLARGKWLLVVYLVFLIGITAPNLCAQTTSATLSGTITDPTGRVVPGVDVKATEVNTGLTTDTKKNGEGIYVLSTLQPGHYRVIVTIPGFKQIALTDVILNVQDTISRNFSLELGATSESITVNDSGVNINTTDGTVSTVVDRQFVGDIPLNGRSLQSLFTLAPGVLENLSDNGQPTNSNSFSVDGVSANLGLNPSCRGCDDSTGNIGAVTALGTTQSLVPIDDLQEFRVLTSTYSAENGRYPGGQFGFLTRS